MLFKHVFFIYIYFGVPHKKANQIWISLSKLRCITHPDLFCSTDMNYTSNYVACCAITLLSAHDYDWRVKKTCTEGVTWGIPRYQNIKETICWLTRVDDIKLFLNNLLCGGQHQITNIEDLHSGHGVLIYLYFRFSPVYCNRMTPQLNPPWEVIEKTISVARLLSLIHLV